MHLIAVVTLQIKIIHEKKLIKYKTLKIKPVCFHCFDTKYNEHIFQNSCCFASETPPPPNLCEFTVSSAYIYTLL